MIDVILFLLPVALIMAAGYRTVRHHPVSRDWRPPSSRLSLLGLLSTLLLLARTIALGRPWWTLIGPTCAVASMCYAYRVSVRAEANYRDWMRRQEEMDG